MQKIFTIFVGVLFFFNISWFGNLTDSGSFNSTQDLTNVEILSSQIVVVDGSTSEDLPSNLGGLISSFQEHFISKILQSGDTIFHKETSIQDIEAFTLYAFPTNSNLDFNTLIEVGNFTESELVILPNRTQTENIWITHSIKVSSGEGVDFQIIAGLNEFMYTDYGDLKVVSINEFLLSFLHSTSELAVTSPLQMCDEILCPANSDLAILGLIFGENFDLIQYSATPFDVGDLSGSVLVLKLNGSLVGFLTDVNYDGSWDFAETIVPGFSVKSFDHNVLMLIPPNVYDLYVMV